MAMDVRINERRLVYFKSNVGEGCTSDLCIKSLFLCLNSRSFQFMFQGKPAGQKAATKIKLQPFKRNRAL